MTGTVITAFTRVVNDVLSIFFLLALNCIRYPTFPLVHKGVHGTPEKTTFPLEYFDYLYTIYIYIYIYTLITTIFQEKNIKYMNRFKMAAK